MSTCITCGKHSRKGRYIGANTVRNVEPMSELDPIYGAFSNPPKPYPLGVPIADKVTIREIDRRAANKIYESHHSYLPRGRQGWHYGVYLDDRLVGEECVCLDFFYRE